MATLEIEVFDFENEFFDNYDSIIKVDSKLTQRILHIEFDAVPCTDIIQLTVIARNFATVLFLNEPRSSDFFYHPKLFLLTSSLLI